MQRDRERDSAIRVLEADVAAALPCDLPAISFQRLDESAGRRRPEGRRSRRGREPAPDHTRVKRAAVFAEALNVELEGLLRVGSRLLKGVSLAVQAREIGGVDVVASSS